jgi:hypothetical protein
MVRKILALLAGFVAANAIIIVAQLVGGLIYGMPRIERGDTAALAAHVASMPTSALLLVAFGYALGYLVAGYLMRKISRWNSIVLPLILGILGTVGWTLNIMNIPHPTWMIALGYLCFIPFALLGHRLASSSDA